MFFRQSAVDMNIKKSTLSVYTSHTFELSLQIMDTLAEIQERHEAVRDVERKLLDLQQVYNQSFQLIWLCYMYDVAQQIRTIGFDSPKTRSWLKRERWDILTVSGKIHVVDFNKCMVCYAHTYNQWLISHKWLRFLIFSSRVRVHFGGTKPCTIGILGWTH